MYEGLGQRGGPQGGQAAGARGYAGPQAAAAAAAAPGVDQLRITAADLDIFENRLQTLQDAFSREDYAKLREITTPEVASYLSEELATNAAKGIRVEARDVTLLQGDVAESWKEGSREYATVAMRYSMVETVRNRETARDRRGRHRAGGIHRGLDLPARLQGRVEALRDPGSLILEGPFMASRPVGSSEPAGFFLGVRQRLACAAREAGQAPARCRA